MRKKRFLKASAIGILVLLAVSVGVFIDRSHDEFRRLRVSYGSLDSAILRDRNGEILEILPNHKQFYAIYGEDFPKEVYEALIAQEDHLFNWHFGVNPWSILRSAGRRVTRGRFGASSTITQQLAKNLLGNEQERTFGNKFREVFGALTLESRLSKKEVLNWYLNTAYFGHQVQGIETAARLYFGKSTEALTQEEISALIATLPSPSSRNPFDTGKIDSDEAEANFRAFRDSPTFFEIKNLISKCEKVTVDGEFNEKVRAILNEYTLALSSKNATHATAVVIKIPENEILAIVGTPDPTSVMGGRQINMAVQPRPIGSTVKPFLYARGFEKGLRPYSLVDDREYKFSTAFGEAHYPKNYDYTYNGIVSLHYSLANSLNVPAVKVLEYIGLSDFADVVRNRLQLETVQPLEEYQYGIALGQMETSLLELVHRFTIFPQHGVLKNVNLCAIRDSEELEEKQVFDEPIVELVNRVLIDRTTGADQFGLENLLEVEGRQVAVKTGTSREYHDSWTIGYTPDFVVGVWLGNTENTAMKDLSGQQGAGRIWKAIVTQLMDSKYDAHTPFEWKEIEDYVIDGQTEYGLEGDNLQVIRNKMLDDALILEPHDGDEFLAEPGTMIHLKASAPAVWRVDGVDLGEAVETEIEAKEGDIEILATREDREERIIIHVNR